MPRHWRFDRAMHQHECQEPPTTLSRHLERQNLGTFIQLVFYRLTLADTQLSLVVLAVEDLGVCEIMSFVDAASVTALQSLPESSQVILVCLRVTINLFQSMFLWCEPVVNFLSTRGLLGWAS